ncbi:MAG: hypothetical protein JRN20_13580 [Nitrososphaerota archaeon]|nr:hypothetical protein [Nitrososphaerota archaeon]
MKKRASIIFFILLGIIVSGSVMIVLSQYLPKQYTSCSVPDTAKGTCIEYQLRGTSICTLLLDPFPIAGSCTVAKPTFWQYTKFWAFDLGLAGFFLIIGSLLIGIVNFVIFSDKVSKKSQSPEIQQSVRD